ncbi:hypothetical protein AA0119_g5158 [Alternaria tenuissima]|uniref:DUF7607 domain-containing protein n=1 Tax=Alternaria tenuissima TaxID=119927 RepID=A0ABY0GC12_9PLEO|nr:hypothetical protein AA0119_g5158 [Alternaria tenuissima]
MPASDTWLWTVDDLHTNALYRDTGYSDAQIPHAMTLHTNSADNSPSVRRTGTSEGVVIIDEAEAYSDLLKWQNIAGGDQIVDLPDEDELEDDEDFGPMDSGEEDTQINEDQHDDVVEETNKRTKLSQDEIVRIINERIEFYTNAWVPNKGVPSKERVDPETVWNEAEAKGEREKLAQHYETEYDYFSQRLNICCDKITKGPGSNTKQVRQQCGNLEGTVDCMEHAAWLRDIYKLEPVHDGEEEHVLDDQSRLRQDTSTHGGEPTSEVIDLGSPSCSSDIENGNVLPFDNDTGTVAHTTEDQFDNRVRSSTRDSVIADSVKLVEYAQLGPFEPDGAFPTRTPVNHGDGPESASIATVRRWRWEDLVEHLDRKRVVSKVIQELKSNDREMIRGRVQNIGKTSLIREMRACVNMLCKGETKLQGVLPRDMPKILTFTTLFLSWWFCCNYSKGPEASSRDLEELKDCMDDGTAETSTFYDYVYTIMGTTFSEQALQHPDQPSQAEIIEISDDD